MARKKTEEGNVDALVPGNDLTPEKLAFAKGLVEHMVQKMAIHGDPDKLVSVNISVYDALAIQSLLKLVGDGFEITPDTAARQECLRLAEVLEI